MINQNTRAKNSITVELKEKEKKVILTHEKQIVKTHFKQLKVKMTCFQFHFPL